MDLLHGAMDRLLRLDAFVRIMIGVYIHNVQLLDVLEFVQQWTPAKCNWPYTRVQNRVLFYSRYDGQEVVHRALEYRTECCSIPAEPGEEKAYVVNEVAPVVTATGKTKSAGSATTVKNWL